MRSLLDRVLGFGVVVILSLIILAAYSTYKFFIWSHVQAVVTSVAPVCVYTRKVGRRSVTEKYLSCDADSEATAAGLIADGFKLRPDKEALVEAVYEAQLGRKTQATLRPWWDDVASLGPGSVIHIRYSPFSPGEAELLTGSEMVPVVILGFFVGALLFACLVGVVTYEGDEQGTSG